MMNRRQSPAEDQTPTRHRSLIELERPDEIVQRIIKVIDASHGRATLLLCQKEPILVDIKFRFHDSPHGIILVHDEREEGEKKASVEADVKDIAALFVRDALIESRLRVTTRNTRKMLNYVIGWTFSETRISADQEVLTSGNLRTIEKTYNGSGLAKIGIWRRVLSGLFTALLLRRDEGNKEKISDKPGPDSILALRRDRERGGLSPLQVEHLALQTLMKRKERDSENKIYDAICRPGISIETTHNGTRRKIDVLRLIEAYVEAGRDATHQRSLDIEEEFNIAQAEAAVDAIIGKSGMERDGKKERARVAREMALSVRMAVDPILAAAIDRLSKKQ